MNPIGLVLVLAGVVCLYAAAAGKTQDFLDILFSPTHTPRQKWSSPGGQPAPGDPNGGGNF